MSKIQLQHLLVLPCRHGVMVWPKSDATIGRSLALYGEFAEGENRIMAAYIRPGDTVVDVGANVGTTVLPLARAVGAQGQVIAFEPQPLMAQCLCTSLSLNELFNVRVLAAALSERSGWAHIEAPDVSAGGNYGAVALGNQGLSVPVMRLDDLALSQLFLLKIDVEGHEWAVLQGAQQTLLRHRPVVYLEAKPIPNTRSCLAWLIDNGWRCYWHFAFFFRPDNFRGQRENIFGGRGDVNVLAVPPDQPQPDNLPQLASADEDWQAVYRPFFEQRQLAQP